ncbi:AraC family transcriptional regulator N-terminal domain-containing protein [Pseudoroseicyclus sp. H15]
MRDTLTELKAEVLRLEEAHGAASPLPGLNLTVRRQPIGLVHSVYHPSLCAVLQGAKTSMLGDHVFRYDAGKCLIASMDVPVRAEITQATPEVPYVAFSLRIEPAVVTDLLVEFSGEPASPPVSPGPALGVHALSPDLVPPLCRLLALCDAPGDQPVLAPMIHREIVWRLLQGPMGPTLRQIGLADSHMARLSRAITRLREEFDAAISVAELAALAGMSAATFHRHFKAATGMTPVQFQKQLRLQEARRLLLANGADVARVGFAIGYESASQFSRDYRRLFGAPPGQDGRAMRQRVAADS